MKKTLLSVLMSNIVGAGLGFFLNVVLARSLTIENFGRISLIFSIVVSLYTIMDFGLCNASVVFINSEKPKAVEGRKLYVLSLFYKYILIVGVSLFLFMPLAKNYFKLNEIEIIAIFIVLIFFIGYRFINSLNQATGSWRKFNTLNILNNVVKFFSIVLFAYVFWYSTGLLTKYSAIIFGYFSYSIILFIIAWSCSGVSKFTYEKNSSLNKGFRIEFSKIIIPIGISNICIIITMRFGFFIIERSVGMEGLAIYSAANTLALVFPLITSSLMNVLLRESASSDVSFLKKIFHNQKKYLTILVIVIVVSFLMSKIVILTIFGQKYLDAVDTFRILLIAYIGGVYFTPLESYFYSHYPSLIMKMRILQMIIVVLGSFLVVNSYGLNGIASVVVISRIVGWSIFYLNSVFRIKRESYEII